MSLADPPAPPPGEEVPDPRRQLLDELKRLRRGWGLSAPALPDELPLLQASCRMEPGLTAAEQRSRLVDRLTVALAVLPSEHQLALRTAFALPHADQSRFFNERMLWLAAQIRRDRRTAIRRTDDAMALLSEILLQDLFPEERGSSPWAPGGWYASRVRSVLMLHLEPVQLEESRRITSTVDQLDAITVSWSVPSGPASRMEVEMLFGGQLRQDAEKSTASYWTGEIRLPEPLARNRSHEYQVRVRTLPREELDPFYVLTPFRRVDEFVLRAKFPPEWPPRRIWRLDGVPFARLGEIPGEDTPALAVNPVGEVEAVFRNLQLGLSHGLRWQPPGPLPAS